MAKKGYNIEQNPNVTNTSRNPDYILEGELADCYSPSSKTSVRNIGSTIDEKVNVKDQAKKVVLNLSDWDGNTDDIVTQLKNYPIENLEEVIAITKDEAIIHLYP